MKKTIKLVDTTLRDGEQCPGVVFRPEDKIKLALMLDEIGLYEIEAGIYDRNTEGTDYLAEILRQRKNTIISIWARLNPKDVAEAAQQKPDLIHIGMPVSYVQIYGKLNKNKKWVEKNLCECLETARGYGVPVTLGMEDASRADMGFIFSIAALAGEWSVDTLRVADTVGILTPQRAGRMVTELKQQLPVKIEVHEHNDLGMAVANSLEMAKCGADYIDCTLGGIGERAGNCNMYEFAHACEARFDTGVSKRDVTRVEQAMQSILSSRNNHG